jgi:SAM-dependent methyltransferase
MLGATEMSGSEGDDQLPLYTELAAWFHLLTAPEDYELDARHALDVLTGTIGTRPRTILELGSGGGNSASHMKAHATLTLTDRSEEMLELSRSINPEVEHVRGDMRTLRLAGRTFDAVFVHDAISYLLDEDDLRATLQTAFAHLRPGGAAIFEPDITLETYADATHHGGHDGADGRRLRYLQWRTDPDPNDSWYVDEFAILMHDADGTSRIAHDAHRLGMFPRATWFRLLAEVGFDDVQAVASPYADHEQGVGAESFVGRRPD